MTNRLEANAVLFQSHAAAAWKDIQMARTANFTDAQMKPLLQNYAASRAMEMEAMKAWQESMA